MVNRQILILTVVLITFTKFCHTQDLLTVDWQKVVCTNHSINHVHSVCNDNNGNTYTLGSYPNNANVLGEEISDSLGAYFLTKQNSNGDKLLVENFGGNENFTFGDIKVCNNGDLILGLNFKSTFFLNGDSLTNSLTWSNIILKLDQNLNLLWFNVFPASSTTYINHLVLDSDENIYVSIPFNDSLFINGYTYSQNSGYGTAIVKLNSAGDILWVHHYYSDNTLTNNNLKIKDNCNSCPKTLFITGVVGGDYIFLDGVLTEQNQSKFNSQLFIATLSDEGDILYTKFIDDGIRSIADIDFYQNKIYIAGAFKDTVNWNNTYLIPNDYSSAYIGELSEQIDLIGFADLQSSKSFYLTDFDISPQYGFLLSGCFDGSFSLQSSSITLANQYERGSFIASINDTLKLSDCKYIEGGYYNLRQLSILNNSITGAAIFDRTCTFENLSINASNIDVSAFQTSNIEQLSTFNPQSFPTPSTPEPQPSPIPSVPFSTQIYPNPFRSSFKIIFSEPISSASITMTNSLGQVVKDVVFSQIDDTEIIIKTSGLQTGLYIIKYVMDNKHKEISKLIKVNEH